MKTTTTRLRIWPLALALPAVLVSGGCPKSQSPDTGPTSVAPPSSVPGPATDEVSETGGSATDAPANIGNGADADGKYVCPVMDTVLAELDEGLSVEHDGKVYFFCCDGCPEAFEKDSAKYVAQIEAGDSVGGAESASDEDGHDDHQGHDHG